MPGLPSKEVSAFLSSLVEGGKDVFYSQGLQRLFFPLRGGEEKLEVKRNRGRRPSVKEEVEEDWEEDEYEDVKDAFDEIPEDRKGEDFEGNLFEDDHEDEYEDEYEDHKSPAHSDEESLSENDVSSDDSDYEKPKKKKKKRKYNLSNLRQFHGRTQEEIQEMNTTPSKTKRKRPFFCSVCDKYFRKESIMLNHVMKKHGPAPAPQCEICNALFESLPKLSYHRRTFHSEKIPCEDCGKSYPRSTMAEHMRQAHDDCEPRACEHCGSVFTNKRKFNLHVKGHLNPVVYKVHDTDKWLEKFKENCRCNVEFNSKKSQVRHYKIVHEKWQECPKCTKVVRNLSEGKHLCEKPQKNRSKGGGTCPECGKYYERELSLWYHINATHSKTPAACEICGKVFKSRVGVKSHMKTHERSTCDLCGKEFTNMKEHMKNMHTADCDQPFKCEHCGKGFPDSLKFRTHMNIHLNLKPYVCR